jgi:hypothetical protein
MGRDIANLIRGIANRGRCFILNRRITRSSNPAEGPAFSNIPRNISSPDFASANFAAHSAHCPACDSNSARSRSSNPSVR